MNRRALAVAAAVLGIAILLYAVFAKKSDEELIREQLDDLAQAVRVSGPDENPIFRGKRLHDKFEKLFVPNVRVDISELTQISSGRTELVGVATRAGTIFRSADVEIDASSVDLIAGGSSAMVSGSATLVGDRGNGTQRDQRRVSFGFAKTKDGCLIAPVVVVPPPSE